MNAAQQHAAALVESAEAGVAQAASEIEQGLFDAAEHSFYRKIPQMSRALPRAVPWMAEFLPWAGRAAGFLVRVVFEPLAYVTMEGEPHFVAPNRRSQSDKAPAAKPGNEFVDNVKRTPPQRLPLRDPSAWVPVPYASERLSVAPPSQDSNATVQVVVASSGSQPPSEPPPASASAAKAPSQARSRRGLSAASRSKVEAARSEIQDVLKNKRELDLLKQALIEAKKVAARTVPAHASAQDENEFTLIRLARGYTASISRASVSLYSPTGRYITGGSLNAMQRVVDEREDALREEAEPNIGRLNAFIAAIARLRPRSSALRALQRSTVETSRELQTRYFAAHGQLGERHQVVSQRLQANQQAINLAHNRIEIWEMELEGLDLQMDNRRLWIADSTQLADVIVQREIAHSHGVLTRADVLRQAMRQPERFAELRGHLNERQQRERELRALSARHSTTSSQIAGTRRTLHQLQVRRHALFNDRNQLSAQGRRQDWNYFSRLAGAVDGFTQAVDGWWPH